MRCKEVAKRKLSCIEKYSKGALEPLTSQRAKSVSRVVSFAGKQADAAWRTDEILCHDFYSVCE